MAVNVIDQAASQEMAVALNQGAIATDLVSKTEELSDDKREVRRREDSQSFIERVLDSEGKGKLGMDLLRGFLTRAASFGVPVHAKVLSGNTKEQALSEYEKIFGKQDLGEDSVSVRQDYVRELSRKGSLRERRDYDLRVGSSEQNTESEEVKGLNLARQSLLSQFIVSNDSKLLKRILQLDQQIEEKILALKQAGQLHPSAATATDPLILDAKRQIEKGGGVVLDEGPEVSLVRDYSATYSQYLLSHNPQLKEELLRLENQLRQKGISDQKILNLQLDCKKDVRQNVADGMRDNILLRLLSESNIIDRVKYELGATNLANSAVRNPKLGGLDFGNYHWGVIEAGRVKYQEASREIQGFLIEELENIAVQQSLGRQVNMKHLTEVLQLSKKVGFDPDLWLDNVWPLKKQDHGLDVYDAPPQINGQMVDTNTDNPQRRHQSQEYLYNTEDEKEILVNRLRAVYMQRALKGDLRTNLSTHFKIRKLKNGMFRLGIFTEELEERVQAEAQVVAQIKTTEMLQEALLERATLYDLRGPAHDLIKRKIKGLLKTAQRLGISLSDQEFVSLQDQANRRMYDLAKRELGIVQAGREIDSSPYLEKKEKALGKLLGRLKEESNIIEDEIAEVEWEQESNVSEAA